MNIETFRCSKNMMIYFAPWFPYREFQQGVRRVVCKNTVHPETQVGRSSATPVQTPWNYGEQQIKNLTKVTVLSSRLPQEDSNYKKAFFVDFIQKKSETT